MVTSSVCMRTWHPWCSMRKAGARSASGAWKRPCCSELPHLHSRAAPWRDNTCCSQTGSTLTHETVEVTPNTFNVQSCFSSSTVAPAGASTTTVEASLTSTHMLARRPAFVSNTLSTVLAAEGSALLARLDKSRRMTSITYYGRAAYKNAASKTCPSRRCSTGPKALDTAGNSLHTHTPAHTVPLNFKPPPQPRNDDGDVINIARVDLPPARCRLRDQRLRR